ncbi:MAG: flippase [Gemmatimonadota bacterium]
MGTNTPLVPVFGRTFRKAFRGPDIPELLRGSSTTLILMLSGIGCSYLFNLAVARMYGASALGLFSLAVTVSGVFSLLGLLGADTAILRFVAAGRIRESWAGIVSLHSKAAALISVVSGMGAVLLFMMSPYLAREVFGKPQLTAALRISASSVPFAAVMGLNTGTLQGLKRIRDAMILRTVFPPAVAGLFLVILTYTVADNYTVPVYANALSLAAGAVVSWVMWRREEMPSSPVEASLRPRLDLQRHALGEFVRVAIPMFLTSAMFYIMDWTDILMLGVYVDDRGVGIYRIASRLALLSSFNLGAANSITTPKFAELFWAGQKERMRALAQFSAKLLFFSSVPIGAGLIVFSSPVMRVFGAEFVLGSNALMVLAAAQCVNAIAGSTGPLLNMTGHQSAFRNIVCCAAVLNVILNLALIPHYGIAGAALGTAISVVLLNVASSIVIRRIFGFWLVFVPFFSNGGRGET